MRKYLTLKNKNITSENLQDAAKALKNWINNQKLIHIQNKHPLSFIGNFYRHIRNKIPILQPLTEYKKETFLTLFDKAGITLKTKLDKDNMQKEH